jgi:hypothetical protein
MGTQAAPVAVPYQVYVQTHSALKTGLLGAAERVLAGRDERAAPGRHRVGRRRRVLAFPELAAYDRRSSEDLRQAA